MINANMIEIKSSASLRGADLRGADLTRAELRDADLTGADLTEADLTGAEMRGAGLTRAYLTGADLTGAEMRGAYLTGAYLRGAKYKGSEVTTTPISVTGLTWDVLIIAGYVRIGCQEHPVQAWREFSDEEISRMAPRALEFWEANKAWILALCAE